MLPKLVFVVYPKACLLQFLILQYFSNLNYSNQDFDNNFSESLYFMFIPSIGQYFDFQYWDPSLPNPLSFLFSHELWVMRHTWLRFQAEFVADSYHLPLLLLLLIEYFLLFECFLYTCQFGQFWKIFELHRNFLSDTRWFLVLFRD